MAFLEVKNLIKNFGDTRVLKGISLTLDKGQVLAVIGASGGGKTTLMRCLNYLETPDDGEIWVEGKRVFPSDSGSDVQRLDFGLVFQSFHLFPQYTALQNVTLAMNSLAERTLKQEKCKLFERKARLKEIRVENERKALELLSRVGLAEKANDYPYQLSGGQQQRVAIARALALSPSVLCFDEPTSALDPELTGEVVKVVKDLRSEGRTMIIVTHEMEFAKNVADKVVFIADGEIAEEGDVNQVFFHPQKEKTKNFLTNGSASAMREA